MEFGVTALRGIDLPRGWLVKSTKIPPDFTSVIAFLGDRGEEEQEARSTVTQPKRAAALEI